MTDVILWTAGVGQRVSDLAAGRVRLPGVVRLKVPTLSGHWIVRRVQNVVQNFIRIPQPLLNAVSLLQAFTKKFSLTILRVYFFF
jgi:hypothetical protein